MLKKIVLAVIVMSIMTAGIFFIRKNASLNTSGVKPISIGFNPGENVQAMEANQKKLEAYLSKRLGQPVAISFLSDYTALIESMRSGNTEFGFLPGFSLVKGEKIAGAHVLLKSFRFGQDFYYGAIAARADRGIQKIEDLKGKSIAWVDATSTSGHLMPKAKLMELLNVDPDQFFKNQIFAGSHEAVVFSIANEKSNIDAIGTYTNDLEGKNSAWNRYLKPEEAKRVKMILVSGPIPNETFSTTEKVIQEKPEVVKKIVEIFSTMHLDPEGKEHLKNIYMIEKMIPAQSSEYDAMRSAAKLLKIEE